ncbi:unnamed protein product [Prunus armeniaca]|uniref:Uncharacterized protein n=1 Tax=Prunus armeniaca TaxID=36596 RepID=A0A6J5X9K3_PRUAR|nr:unnamed protein product [Prunus armeniaca]
MVCRGWGGWISGCSLRGRSWGMGRGERETEPREAESREKREGERNGGGRWTNGGEGREMGS